MTCKDCRDRRKCECGFKSYRYNDDGDSWANWCDGFNSKHRTRRIKYKGYIVEQSGYNWHVMVIDPATDKMVLHAACEKRQSKRQLRETVRFCIETLPGLIADLDGGGE